MPHLFLKSLIAAVAAVLWTTGVQAQQDTSHLQDTTRHARQHRHRDTTTSKGSIAGHRVRNQSQSGVVNKKGKSTLGPRVKKTTPTQDQPVTAKGDTLRKADSTHKRPPHQ